MSNPNTPVSFAVNPRVLALAGGVGGAKLALGLANTLPPGDLAIGVNTGDDEIFHGLHVSPDLDTVMYTLAGLSNPETGWGLAGDTFQALGMLRRYGIDAWFNLGDRDLATHIRRTDLLAQGQSLSQVTAELSRNLGIAHHIIPMSDDSVRTVLDTDEGELPMQQYFVRRRSGPKVTAVRYLGSELACPSPGLAAAIAGARMVVMCPSNPYLSLAPILSVPGVREGLAAFSRPRIAVSPIVGADAVKGPAGKIMAELGHQVSALEVAKEYRDICDIFVMDNQDANLGPAIAEMGIEPLFTNTIMDTEEDKNSLAMEILGLMASAG